MVRTPKAALVLLLLCCAVPRTAAAEWTYGVSDHFDVFTTGGSGRARNALTFFERVRAYFATALQIDPALRTRTRIIVFSNAREFKPFTINETAAAFFAPGFADRNHIVLRSLDVESYPIVVHEYVHLLISKSAGRYPVWLNEGLAEYFSTLSPDGNQMSVGRVALGRLFYLRDGEPMLPLERLFAVKHGDPEYGTREHAGVFYSQSWALTHMLFTHERYRAARSRFLDAVSRGASAVDALQTIYGRTPKQVMDDLMIYIRNDRFGSYLENYRDPKPATDYPIRKASDFEGELATTTVLATRRERAGDVRAAYDRLTAADPAHVELAEASGYFELYSGQHERAAAAFGRAVAAGSRDPAVHVELAALTEDLPRREQLLARSLELAPDDIDIRLRYADVQLRQNRIQRAAEALGGIKHVTDAQAFMYFQLVANTALREGAFDAASAAAGKAHEYARSAEQIEYATRLIALVQSAGIRASVARPAAPPDARAGPTTPSPSASTATEAANAASARPAEPARPDPDANNGSEIVVEGRVLNIVCTGGIPIMEVEAAGKRLRLAVDQPQRILPPGSAPRDFTCGRQNTPGRIGYVTAGKPEGTDGFLRLADLQ